MEEETDELLMRMVELAMTQPESERDAYLQTVCADNLGLLTKARSYVDWEERMKGFLQEPLHQPAFVEHPFASGDLLDNRFRILREIAQGGMGIVYEAFDETLRRHTAIKAAKIGFRDWLPSEVRNAREITHANVCKIFELHTTTTVHGELDFITMEYLDGPTLKERLRSGKPPKLEAYSIARQLCAGLAAAHQENVIHGDLKSNNVILATAPGGKLRAVITDFGLARSTNGPQFGSSARRAGTPDYMAPELWRGEKPTPASDIYALGVLLGEVLLGAQPSNTPSWHRPATRHQGKARFAGHALARCVHPDPSARYLTADAVWRALDPVRSRRMFLTGSAAVVAGAAVTWGFLSFPTPSISAVPSLAVIPFENTSGSQDSQFLSDGLSEEVINALSQLSEMKVVARTSSFKYSLATLDIRKASETLGVKALVLGRIAVGSNQLRMNVELVNGMDGSRLWGAQYDRPLTALATVQTQLSHDIAAQIRATLSPSEKQRLASRATTNPEAYERLLRARYQRSLYRTDSRQQAINFYEQALGLDPGFALAHAELALTFRYMSAGGVLDPIEALPNAEAAARRALAIAPTLPEAHLALAEIHKDQWDWGTAEQEYRQSLSLSPSVVEAHQGFAIYLSELGRYDEAVAEIRRAMDLDPLGLSTAITAIGVFYNCDRFDDALQQTNRAESLDPLAPVPWSWRGMINGGIGRFSEALPAYEKAIQLGDHTGVLQCFYAYSLARAGHEEQARRILADLSRSKGFVPPSAYALIYLGLREKERALQALEAAFEQRDSMLQYLKVEAHYDALQDDPRYRALATRMGLP